MCFIICFGISVLITGCGEEDIVEPEEEMAEPEDPCMQEAPPHTGPLFSITPSPGAVISSNQEFTLDFDMVVVEVTVNRISATGSGRMWVVSLILEPGTRDFAVEWTESNGCIGVQAMGPYTVVADED